MKLRIGVFQIDDASCSPAAAVPASAKIPVPMIAPMPMQVSANGPRARVICRSGLAASAIKRSGLFFRKSSSAMRKSSRNRVTAMEQRSMQSFDVVAAFVSNADLINRRLAQAPLQLGPPLAAQDQHDQSKRRQLDRRLCFWLNRVRRLHLRQANESLEANVPRHRVDDL